MVAALDQGIRLNWQQSEAVHEFLQFMGNSSKRVYAFYGMGGTGKTFAVKYALIQLWQKGYKGKIGAIAPTNSACKTLKKALRGVRAISVTTVASALGLKPIIGSDGKQVFVSERKYTRNEYGELEEEKVSLEMYDLLIIEEASMINRSQFRQIVTKLKGSCKILVLMDQWQLKPVGDYLIEAVNFVGNNFYQLTKTERYSEDSYIYKVIQASLQAVITKDKYYNPLAEFPESVPENDHGYGYFVYDTEKLALESFARQVDRMIQTKQYDYTRLITWRKITIDKYNRIVRNLVVPYANVQCVVPEEMLITWGTVKREDPQTGHDYVLYQTASTLIVEQSKMQMVLDENGKEWKVWECLVFDPDEDDNGSRYNWINFIDYDFKTAYYKKQAELEKALAASGERHSKAWKIAQLRLDKFNKLVDPVRHGYCINAYGAQGTSFWTIYKAWTTDLQYQRNKDFDAMNRSNYVADSRAKARINVF
jgi:hypothetical protein